MSIVAVIVSYDLGLGRFRLVLDRASGQVDHVIIVDNDSRGKGVLRDLCGGFGNCDFVEVGFNSGVAHALRVGVNYASKSSRIGCCSLMMILCLWAMLWVRCLV